VLVALADRAKRLALLPVMIMQGVRSAVQLALSLLVPELVALRRCRWCRYWF